MEEESCNTCKYFESEDDQDVGFCHRYPPVLITKIHKHEIIDRSCPYDLSQKFQFPALSFVHVCGEHKER